MCASEQQPPLVALVGPTGVGKTALSLELAEALGGEIVSADSRLFYVGMDIGTAKPSREDRARVAHHLIDVSEPDEEWSLARFQQAATTAIGDVHARGRLPFLVGGTGQFVRAILEGWSIPPLREDPQLRAVLGTWAADIGREALHERLAVLDAKAARAIDARNVRRTVRALEVILKSGRKFSEQRGRSAPPYRVLQIGVTRPRRVLYERIDQRVEAMFSAGLVEEVKALLEKYPPDLRSFSAIGYREVIRHLQGEMGLEQTLQEVRRASRTLVRRQAAWFKPNDPAIRWFSLEETPAVQILDVIQSILSVGNRQRYHR
jgi:tRNA dimethylallyltransferase